MTNVLQCRGRALADYMNAVYRRPPQRSEATGPSLLWGYLRGWGSGWGGFQERGGPAGGAGRRAFQKCRCRSVAQAALKFRSSSTCRKAHQVIGQRAAAEERERRSGRMPSSSLFLLFPDLLLLRFSLRHFLRLVSQNQAVEHRAGGFLILSIEL
jgi:hypothetical protein